MLLRLKPRCFQRRHRQLGSSGLLVHPDLMLQTRSERCNVFLDNKIKSPVDDCVMAKILASVISYFPFSALLCLGICVHCVVCLVLPLFLLYGYNEVSKYLNTF
jgi:hypothetical protein